MQPAFRIGAIHTQFRGILDALDDKNLFSYPYFHATHTHPTAKFLKLYVRVVNSTHFMQNNDENRVKIRSDKSISFSKKLVWNLSLSDIYLQLSRPNAPFAPICSTPGRKNKLVEISQNYLVIFTENRERPTSNACNFLEKHILTPVLKRVL